MFGKKAKISLRHDAAALHVAVDLHVDDLLLTSTRPPCTTASEQQLQDGHAGPQLLRLGRTRRNHVAVVNTNGVASEDDFEFLRSVVLFGFQLAVVVPLLQQLCQHRLTYRQTDRPTDSRLGRNVFTSQRKSILKKTQSIETRIGVICVQ